MDFRSKLARLANQVMEEKGLEPGFSKEAQEQLANISRPALHSAAHEDLSSLIWCSIDNYDSRDLDQLTYAEKNSDGSFSVWVAIADVDALINKDSPIDKHAQINTTSVYTPAKIFFMVPEKLSTNLTSLNENEERVSVVVKMKIDKNGEIADSAIIQAVVRNHAKLVYEDVGDWFAGKKEVPEKIAQAPGLEKALKIQFEVSQLLKKNRHSAGSLTLEPHEFFIRLQNDHQVVIQSFFRSYAHELIEEFMIGANRAMADHFRRENIASLRRVVRTPKQWDRIVEIAATHGFPLPHQPDARALEAFLIKRQKEDPDSFHDLSLTMIKLLGKGEYIVENQSGHPVGHFDLAVTNYTHSTAPNRRFPDLISQRQCKAYLQGRNNPYSLKELVHLAAHCSQQEQAAMKVERRMNKSAAAALLFSQVGNVFNGIITGASEKGTWVHIFHPSIEGKVIRGFEPLKVGEKVAVRLKEVDIPKGYIDFERVLRGEYRSK